MSSRETVGLIIIKALRGGGEGDKQANSDSLAHSGKYSTLSISLIHLLYLRDFGTFGVTVVNKSCN